MPSGGIVGDNLGQFAPEVIFAIATSEVEKGLIWAGNQRRQGLVHARRRREVERRLEEHHRHAGVGHGVEDRAVAFQRRHGLRRGRRAPDGQPRAVHLQDDRLRRDLEAGERRSAERASAVATSRRSPRTRTRRGMLFAGTGHGFYYSIDDGGHWTELSAGLPHAPVSWVVVQKQFHDVVVSTYGRGLYVLDDITPLEQDDAGDDRRGRASVRAARRVPLVAARPRADQLLAEGGAARSGAAAGARRRRQGRPRPADDAARRA